MVEHFGSIRPKDSFERQGEELTVEIGCGGFPQLSRMSADERRAFLSDASRRYIGIDISEWDAHAARRSVRRDAIAAAGASERAHFLVADARRLPLPDSSASEAILSNVLGDPEIFLNERSEILNETYRIVRLGGTLKVIETYTPHRAESAGGELAELGFRRFTPEEEEALSAAERASDALILRENEGNRISYYRKQR